MSRSTCCTALALAAVLIASDRPAPTAAHADPEGQPPAEAASSQASKERAAMDRLARSVARALDDAEFRAYLKSELDRSPIVEHKLQFQAFLRRSNQRALREVARLTGQGEATLEADAGEAIPLE